MALQNAVFVSNLSTEFDIGVATPNEITIKLDGTLVKNPDGTIGMNGGAITVISADAGQLIIAGSDGGAYLNQAALQAVETVWSGSEADGFLTVTPAGINGHTVTYGFDWTNAAFKEAVQDAIGESVLAGAGITYDDVANAISTNLGNITFGDGLNYDTGANVVTVKPDPASPSTVSVSPAGVSVTANVSTDAGQIATLGTDNKILVTETAVTGLATIDVCDAFGVSMFKAFPA